MEGKESKILNQSPRPQTPVTMDFPNAMRLIIEGKKITKLEWGDKNLYGILANGLLMLHKEDGFHTWVISEGDLIGKDWVLNEGGDLPKVNIN